MLYMKEGKKELVFTLLSTDRNQEPGRNSISS